MSLRDRFLSRFWKASTRECHQFWENAAMTSPGNRPEDYAKKGSQIVDFLLAFWDIPITASVLELGCNVGRNLFRLQLRGYRVKGLEISADAIEKSESLYPSLHHRFFHGAIENYTHTLWYPNVILSIAALQHVRRPPWDEICQSQTVCLIEHPKGQCRFQFAHPYRRELTKRGFRILKHKNVHVEGYAGYQAILARRYA